MRPTAARQSHAYLERVLDGEAAPQDALAKLIAAARAPQAPADPAGLAVALTAFREVSASHPSNPRRPSMIKNIAAKVVAAKVLAVAGLALAATGGMAAAASTGHLPSPLPHSSHASDTAVAAVAASHNQPTSTSTATESPSASPSAEPSSSQPAANPSPSLRGLCQAWLSRPHEHGKADTSPAFSYLVSTAGGTDSVDSYCTSLLASPSASPTESDGTDDQSGKPSTVPSHSHPSGKPSTVPSASHPSGKPSPLPTPSRH
jgi:hypothetical protein